MPGKSQSPTRFSALIRVMTFCSAWFAISCRRSSRARIKALGRADIARTGGKMYKQKGTGRARHHSARAPQFRGGGKAHGPVVRSHAHDLPKKVRALALRHALSAKAKASELIIIDSLVATEAKTKVSGEQRWRSWALPMP